MVAEWFQITAIISIVATFFAIVGGAVVVIKFLLDLKKELSEFKDEMRKEFSSFKDEMRKEFSEIKTDTNIEIVKLQSRFDKYDGVHTDIEAKLAEIQKQQVSLSEQLIKTSSQMEATKEQVSEIKAQTVASINKVETENRDFLQKLVQSVAH